ncbi:MAG: sporulation protein [Ruminococcaceae bacterium]|nr:sporulation protein [Oscillospiraceae bacterium]
MNFKKAVKSITGLPSEIILNTPKMTVEADEKIRIENFKGLVEYTDKFICINTNTFTIKIEGELLNIGYMTKEEICILGSIKNINYD